MRERLSNIPLGRQNTGSFRILPPFSFALHKTRRKFATNHISNSRIDAIPYVRRKAIARACEERMEMSVMHLEETLSHIRAGKAQRAHPRIKCW